MDAKREEFRKYLEKEGVLEFLTKQLVKLYEETDKPENALDYLKNNVAESNAHVSDLKKIAELEKENLQLKEDLKNYEERIKVLEQKDIKEATSADDVPPQEEEETEKMVSDAPPQEEEEIEKMVSDAPPQEEEEIEKMVSDDEQYKAEDEKQKERITAKNGLESYCFNMKTTVEDEKFKDKINDSDKEAITKKCEETIKWIDANQLAEVDEFQDKQKEVESACSPITSLLYQQAGGAPGGMPEGMPDAKDSAGPTIEEATSADDVPPQEEEEVEKMVSDTIEEVN